MDHSIRPKNGRRSCARRCADFAPGGPPKRYRKVRVNGTPIDARRPTGNATPLFLRSRPGCHQLSERSHDHCPILRPITRCHQCPIRGRRHHRCTSPADDYKHHRAHRGTSPEDRAARQLRCRARSRSSGRRLQALAVPPPRHGDDGSELGQPRWRPSPCPGPARAKEQYSTSSTLLRLYVCLASQAQCLIADSGEIRMATCRHH
jgi:hypothetical protein